jgi:hypothetical protein
VLFFLVILIVSIAFLRTAKFEQITHDSINHKKIEQRETV